MKKIIALVFLLACTLGYTYAQKGPQFTFKDADNTYNFGKVKTGTKPEHYFEFTNTGDQPIVIASAEGSCVCTVPEWPKRPIPPGRSEKIKVVFDAKSAGPINRSVYIKSNASKTPVELKIKGEVAD